VIISGDMSEPKDALYERVPGVFEPDTLLASQYFDRLRRRAGHGGEWALVIAILEDAVNVYLKQASATEEHNRRLFVEAEEWIEQDDPTWIFSFRSICDLLGLDADYIRDGLRAVKRRARRADARIEVAVDEAGDDVMKRASGE